MTALLRQTLARCRGNPNLARSCSSKPPQLPVTVQSAASVFLLGSVAGGLGSLVGLGGAFIIIPVLSGPLGFSAHQAIGTSMAAVLATSLGATASYTTSPASTDTEAAAASAASPQHDLLFGCLPRRLGLVDVPAALTVIAFSAVFAVLGALASKRVPDRVVRQAQGVLMMGIAPSLLLCDYLKRAPARPRASSSAEDNERDGRGRDDSGGAAPKDGLVQDMCSAGGFVACGATQRLALIGTVSGLAAGFFGIGGGAVTVPALVLLLDFDYRTALATSLVVMVPTSLTGAAMHFLQSTMLVGHAIPLSIGTAAGAYCGGYFSRYVDEKKLKDLFGVTMFTLGLRTLLKARACGR